MHTNEKNCEKNTQSYQIQTIGLHRIWSFNTKITSMKTASYYLLSI